MAARRRRKGGVGKPPTPQRKRPAPPAKPGKPDGWLFDRTVEHQTYLERLKNLEGPRIAETFAEAGARIERLTRTLLDDLAGRGVADRPWETVRYAEYVDRLGSAYRAAAAGLKDGAAELMLSVMRLEAEWQGRILYQSLPFDISFSKPPLEQLRAWVSSPIEGRTLADWSEGLSQSAQAQVEQVVQRGLMRGSSTQSMTAELRAATTRSAAHAETIVRTAVSHASSGAREAFGQANQDIVVGVRWVSVLDARTSFQCAALSGKVFALGDGPRPPAHPRCRSTVVMLQRTAEEILSGNYAEVTPSYLEAAGKRATASVTQPGLDAAANTMRDYRASTTFGGWLKQQPAVTQDRILGRSRGLLFRRGELTIEQFVGDNYQPLSLNELAAKWGITIPR